jgi:hypothetical protein
MVGGEDHAGGADSALGSASFEEALLDGVELLVDCEAFDGGDLRAFHLQDGDEAGVDQITIHQDGAGAALAFAAALLGSGEVKIFAEYVEETLHRRSFDCSFAAIDGELDRRIHIESNQIFLKRMIINTIMTPTRMVFRGAKSSSGRSRPMLWKARFIRPFRRKIENNGRITTKHTIWVLIR